ncbi:MAG: VOC family protein [Alphaproteobacteria bacterium]|nr:VOC family protein [Alphaproteobacteria bacterium]
MTAAPGRFLNLQTCIYRVSDLAKAKAWYTEVLGAPPYFDEPFYVGFSVAGFELGLMPGETEIAEHPGVQCYWGVADAPAEHARLLSLGGAALEEPHDVGEGIVVAAVRDPFGNPFGVICNPHFTK